MHVVMLVVCNCGGRQFARKPTNESPPLEGFLANWWLRRIKGSGLVAPAHIKPVTAMPVFSSDVQQYIICKSGGELTTSRFQGSKDDACARLV